MLEVEMKKEFHQYYMVIKGDEKEDYALQMVTNNNIKGLLKMEIQKIDDHKYYLYDVTGMQSMKKYSEKEMLKKIQIKKILQDILGTIQNSAAYLLEADDFVLDPAYIFLHKSNYQVYLCYKRGYHQILEEQLVELMEYIMNQVDYGDDESVNFVYHLYQMVREEDCTLQVLLEHVRERSEQKEIEADLIQEERKEEKREDIYGSQEIFYENLNTGNGQFEESKKRKKTLVSCIVTLMVSLVAVFLLKKTCFLVDAQTNQLDWMKVFIITIIIIFIDGYAIKQLFEGNNSIKIQKQTSKETQTPSNNIKQVKKENFNYYGQESAVSLTRVVEKMEEEPTVVLEENWKKEEQLDMYKLIPINKNSYKEIKIIEFPFFIGKLKRNANDIIQSSTVSRVHGKLDRIGDKFYITDLNSTNGTYINHKLIRANERVQIKPGDELSFADVRYQFIK